MAGGDPAQELLQLGAQLPRLLVLVVGKILHHGAHQDLQDLQDRRDNLFNSLDSGNTLVISHLGLLKYI